MLSGQRNHVLASVFPSATFTVPTPEVTPVIGVLASPARTFGGFIEPEEAVGNAVHLSRTWSVATRFLSISTEHDGNKATAKSTSDVRRAFIQLCATQSSLKELGSWYANELASHFRRHVSPALSFWSRSTSSEDASEIILRTIRVLADARSVYLTRLQTIYWDLSSGSEQANVAAFISLVESRFHSIVSQSLDQQNVERVLSNLLFKLMSQSLSENLDIERCSKAGNCRCIVNLGDFPLTDLCSVGLAGRTFEKAFALAIHKLIAGPAVERHCFLVDWIGREHVISRLQQWIDEVFVPFIERTIGVTLQSPKYQLPSADRADIVKAAINSLGQQRTKDIFEYVNKWPASEGAIRDLREYIALDGPMHKPLVCNSFSNQVNERLLHSGASTSEILSIYINLIHTFRALDSRGVLLEKVSTPVRSYLRSRDDTVNIIAASLLFTTSLDSNNGKVDTARICVDIPAEIERSVGEDHKQEQTSNWSDMDWVPDPIDAGPDYKSSKSEDVVAYILALFEQDEFINELRNVLATSLMASRDKEYARETRLIEILKTRLDVTKLQAIEVMLKDVRDSIIINRRINPASVARKDAPPTPQEVWSMIPDKGISPRALYEKFDRRIKQSHFQAILETVATKRQKLVFPKRTRIRPSPAVAINKIDGFSVQVISKNFWPDSSEDQYKLPETLAKAEAEFKDRFEKMGSQRKLHFRPASGRVTVELQLEDRVYKEENVQTWKASIIDAFTSSEESPEDSITLNTDQLVEMLEMDEDLVKSALNFWISKKVLYQPTKGSYAVLERLDMEVIQDEDVEAETNGGTPVKAQDAMLQASAPMFCTFISHMLRNAGSKEVEGMMGITDMLKMVCPMFTYGDDEVRWLLSTMESRGEVTHNGELWTVT